MSEKVEITKILVEVRRDAVPSRDTKRALEEIAWFSSIADMRGSKHYEFGPRQMRMRFAERPAA